jgi:hypothetical protein
LIAATSHAAGENFIRIMPGVAQAIEEVLRSGHVPRAHGRLFAIQVGGLAVVSAKRCFERASRHSLCEYRKRKRRTVSSRRMMRLPGDLASSNKTQIVTLRLLLRNASRRLLGDVTASHFAASLDHLVGAGEQGCSTGNFWTRRRNFIALLGGLTPPRGPTA